MQNQLIYPRKKKVVNLRFMGIKKLKKKLLPKNKIKLNY